MSRFLVIAFVSVLAFVGNGRGAGQTNILWIVADDMSANFSCYGETLIATPHVDRLAREGTKFNHAFATAPVCSPMRSAFITGMYQTSIGAHHHRTGRGRVKNTLPEGVVPIPVLFQRAGYFTCIGTGLLEPGRAARPKGAGAGPSRTDYNFEWDALMYDSNDWSARAPGQPFFMQVQIPGGKLRGRGPAEARSVLERAQAMFGHATVPDAVVLPPYYPRDPGLLLDWAAYLDSVRLTDRHVGDVLARLAQEGILEQTVVIFTTDHGISHARGKQFLYDEGTHVPFVVRGPGIARGRERNDLIELIDLAAISLAAAGIPLPGTMHAQNVFAGGYRPRDAVYGARDRCDETVDRIRSVRTGRFLYVRNYHPQRPHLQPNAYKDATNNVKILRALHAAGKLDPLSARLLFSPTRPPEELYEWTIDRSQVKNLATDPAHATTLQTLRARLEQWMAETGDRGPEAETMYDSDMAVYVQARTGKGGDESDEVIRRNIQLMKKWAAEGK